MNLLKTMCLHNNAGTYLVVDRLSKTFYQFVIYCYELNALTSDNLT